MIAGSLGGFAAGEGGGDRDVTLRLARGERVERPPGIGGAAQPELGEAGVVGRVIGERRLCERGLADERQRGGVVAIRVASRTFGERPVSREGAGRSFRGRGHQPQIARARRHRRVGRRREPRRLGGRLRRD